MEAAVYGTVLWGASFAMILWATGTVMRPGSTLAVGSANVAANAAPLSGTWEQAARRAGMTETRVNQMRAEMPTATRVQDMSAEAAWWSFAGIALSLLAAVGGVVASSGPNPAFGGIIFRRTDPVPTPSVCPRGRAGSSAAARSAAPDTTPAKIEPAVSSAIGN